MRNLTLYTAVRRIDRMILLVMIIVLSYACSSGKRNPRSETEIETITTNPGSDGVPIHLEFRKGPSHNHPLMAVWLEDMDGNYLETLYVAASIGTGIFGHGKVTDGHWEPGPVSRPAALPYWWHKYGFLPTPDNRVPDAVTAPTPEGDFRLVSRASGKLPQEVCVLMELNQSWDWNEFWTNNKYPDNRAYQTSSQPAVVYRAVVDLSVPDTTYRMDVIGHSHYAGEDGGLYEDIESLSTALEIAGVIKVRTGNK